MILEYQERERWRKFEDLYEEHKDDIANSGVIIEGHPILTKFTNWITDIYIWKLNRDKKRNEWKQEIYREEREKNELLQEQRG